MLGSLKKKKPLPRLQFSQILALPRDDDFMLNLNNSIKGEIDPYKFEELERYFVAILNRLNGVEVEKRTLFSSSSHHFIPQSSPHVKVEPAFCTTGDKNLVYEVCKRLLAIVTSQNYREFRGYKWPFEIWGYGTGPHRYIPEIYIGPRTPPAYTLQARLVYEVEIVVFYLLHFARLPIEQRAYFIDGSMFQLSTVKKTYKKLFDAYLNMFLPDALKNKKKGEDRHRKSVPFIQVFGDMWFSAPYSELPIIYRIQLLPLMNELIKRVVKTQAFHQWEWQIVGKKKTSFGTVESSPSCLSYESQSLQRPLFQFLFQAFTQWPLDRIQDIETVVEMWLQFVTPWNIEKNRQTLMSDKEFRSVWGQWIAENLVFYSTLLKEFLRLWVNLDFRPLWALKMLNKVLANFDDRVVGVLKEYERALIESSCGYKDSQNQWTLKVNRMLEDCYPQGQGDHGFVFHKPQTQLIAASQSFSYLSARSVKFPNDVSSDNSGPCFKLATTLMNNLLEFQAQCKDPCTSFSANLWTRIFGEFSPVKPASWGVTRNSRQDYQKSIKHIVRLFKVEPQVPFPKQAYSGYGLNYCEVDENGYLTDRGRQQLISGERIINPQNLKNLKEDIWEKPPMEFEIEILLNLMMKLEFLLLDSLGLKEEETKKKHFMYGFGRRFASTSAIFWYCVIFLGIYCWFPSILVLVFTTCTSGALLAYFYPIK